MKISKEKLERALQISAAAPELVQCGCWILIAIFLIGYHVINHLVYGT